MPMAIISPFTPPPGTYTVKFVTAASGHVIEASHSTVVVSQSFGPFTVNSGGSSANINFAEVDQGSIGGTVYLDVNDSGVQGDTTGETGISNVTVTLRAPTISAPPSAEQRRPTPAASTPSRASAEQLDRLHHQGDAAGRLS